jgi:hypothetical protein
MRSAVAALPPKDPDRMVQTVQQMTPMTIGARRHESRVVQSFSICVQVGTMNPRLSRTNPTAGVP